MRLEISAAYDSRVKFSGPKRVPAEKPSGLRLNATPQFSRTKKLTGWDLNPRLYSEEILAAAAHYFYKMSMIMHTVFDVDNPKHARFTAASNTYNSTLSI